MHAMFDSKENGKLARGVIPQKLHLLNQLTLLDVCLPACNVPKEQELVENVRHSTSDTTRRLRPCP